MNWGKMAREREREFDLEGGGMQHIRRVSALERLCVAALHLLPNASCVVVFWPAQAIICSVRLDDLQYQ